MICYRAYIVFYPNTMTGWWKYPRSGVGYRSIDSALGRLVWPLTHYEVVEVWKFHEGTPLRDGGVPWFAPELVETYVKGVKQ